MKINLSMGVIEPSQNIIEKPQVYRSFFSKFLDQKQQKPLFGRVGTGLFFSFFSLKCTETFQSSSKYIGTLDLVRVGQH